MPSLKTLQKSPDREIPGGEIYVESGSLTGEKPIEYFIIDPPVEVGFSDQKVYGIKPRHNHEKHKIACTDSIVRESTGDNPMNFVNHMVSWVWQREYNNVSDLIENVRRFGITRRVGLENLQKMSRESLLVLVHSKGYIENWRKYGNMLRPCPKTVNDCGTIPESHILWGAGSNPPSTMCAGYWWGDIEGGRAVDNGLPLSGNMVYRDFVPSDKEAMAGYSTWSYVGFASPVEPKYSPAMVLRLPISRVLVSETLLPSVREACENAGFPVEMV